MSKKLTLDDLLALPVDVQQEVKETLKAYSRVFITYEQGGYKVTTGLAVKAQYADDHQQIGVVEQETVYTPQERLENYIETFHDYPSNYTGPRDYASLRTLKGE